jgi:RimJ/RimL family protein N-acetyltransferase
MSATHQPLGSGGFEEAIVPDIRDYSAREGLRDGQEIEIRALRPEDRNALLAAVAHSSAQSLYRRFFAVKRNFTEQEISFFLNVDFVTHVALVAVLGEHGQSKLVGGARYVMTEPQRAEVAFAIVDEHQGRGIGKILLSHLARIARSAGIEEFVADVLPQNTAMLRVFAGSGLIFTAKRDGSTTHVVLKLV